MTLPEWLTTLVILALLVATVILSNHQDMRCRSIKEQVAYQVRVELAKRPNMPSINVNRASVYAADGEVVIQDESEGGK